MKVLKKLCLSLGILSVLLLSGCSQNVTDKQITATIGNEQYTGAYTGVAKFDKAEGEGTLTVKDNKTEWSYKGTWSDSKVVGNGTIKDKPISFTFQGKEFKGTYTGNSVNGVPSGAGEFTYAKDKDTLNYQGNFENGNAKGKGTLKTTLLTVKFPTVTRIGTYSGEVIDFIPNGKGEFTATRDDGETYTYKGEWENGAFNGQGERTWKDKTFYNFIGTFKDCIFTPTIRELYVSLGTAPDLTYEVSDKAQTFLDKHTSFFPSKSQQELESYVDSSIKWEHIAKNPNDFGDHLIKLSNLHVTQVQEFQIEDGRYGTSIVSIGSDEKVYYTIYPGKCNAYEGNIITMYGLPIGYSSYSNVSGGKTLACMLAGCYIA